MLDLKLPASAPLAIAFSGGGDSTALVHMLRGRHPKPLVLIVDHALRQGSDHEAAKAREFAQNLGLSAEILTWGHDNPKSGVQEKARKGRYGLMGARCRAAGIKYLLTAHTEDDQAETLVMRYDRGTDWRGAAGMANEIHAPLWPELAGVTLLRPLLGTSRQTLRDYNRENNLAWSEDPSNENRAFTRIRARDYLGQRPGQKQHLLAAAKDMQAGLEREQPVLERALESRVNVDPYGLARLSGPIPSRLLGFILRAVSGTGGPIEDKKLRRLSGQMWQPGFKGATLAGAMALRRGDHIILGPDPGRYAGRANQPALEEQTWPHETDKIWDGRFQINNRCGADIKIMTPLNLSGEMSEGQKQNLRAVPHIWRGTTPLAVGSSDEVYAMPGGPQPHMDLGVHIECLVAPRLHSLISGRRWRH